MNTTKRFFSFLLVILIAVNAFASPVFAASIDKDKTVSLTVSMRTGEKNITGVLFNIYLVADCDENGKLTTSEEFRKFNIEEYGKNSEIPTDIALDIENHVTVNDIKSYDSGKTDANGIVSFPTTEKALKQGLYLVSAPRHIENDTAYDMTPFLVRLPSYNQQTNSWVYDVKVAPKFTDEDIQETVTRKVLKVWEDKGFENARPESITVKLLKDGKYFETVTLSRENNWSYRWEELDGKSKWTVTEDPVDGYVSTVSREGITFVIKNTLLTTEPDDTTDEPFEDTTDGTTDDTTGETSSENPDESTTTSPDETTNENENGTENLPQTGLLLWPVVLLFTLGLLFIASGLVRRRSSK